MDKEQIYFVKGMHCASCEVLIEKKLLELKGIESADASTAKGQALIIYREEKPTSETLNKIFKENGYFFSEKSFRAEEVSRVNGWLIFSVSLLAISVFYFLQKTGLSSLVSINSKSNLPAFFVFGLLAGVSSCAALVGGLVLSMSKQWLELYSDRDSFWQKSQPHFLFNAGRLISYGLLGGALGLVGKKLQFSLTASSILVIVVSILMILLALQMLGIKAFRKFQITVPKFLTKKITDESNFRGRLMPFILGALTFFLPCGFTLTAQGAALLSGSALNGGLIMFLFALGTSPTLLAIGLTSVKFIKNHRLSANFLKIAAILILFFALFNLNSQLNILGAPSFSSLANQITKENYSNSPGQQNQDKDLPPIVEGKQILKMQASSSGYSPSYLKVRAGIPVKWEIQDIGTSGCTNAVISRNLFDGEIALTPGQTSIKEFTPTKTGKYRFSCWMGMISGTIEVVNPSSSAVPAVNAATEQDNNSVIPSGASGCGCSGKKSTQ
jgi:sulfite exporter TauE/SafE/copper chaperone CopZ